MISEQDQIADDETDLVDWLLDKISALDRGLLAQDEIDRCDRGVPGWRSDDTRFSLFLGTEWSDERMENYLIEQITEWDAGTMTQEHQAMLDGTYPGWRHDRFSGWFGRPLV